MDIFAHALWTNALYEGAARRRGISRSRKAIGLAMLFGVIPDFISFGPYFIQNILTRSFHFAPPTGIPSYVYQLYNFTHSLVIFAVVFAIVWAFIRRPPYLLLAWSFHICIDIFSHVEKFFPTPFLFPLSNFHVSLFNWGNPTFMAVNYSCIAVVYLLLYAHKRRSLRQVEEQ